uniref:Uncharacterized protein n=1 Tax=Avena sativa TaxID=4498 RepID=A0ACD5U0R2_AVESA
MVKLHLSIFSDHIFVGSSDGILILVEKNEPYHVKLWEPFTGYHVQFATGIIDEHLFHFAMETRGVPRLFYVPGYYDGKRVMCYCADKGCLEVPFGDMPVVSVASMTAYKNDVFVLFRNRQLFKITGTGHAVHGELILIYQAPESAGYAMKQCLVESEGNLLLVSSCIKQLLIFRVDLKQRTTERIYDLGRQTLFLGLQRCISVNADKFSVVAQNCLYQVCISTDTRQLKMGEYSLMSSQKHTVYEPFINDIIYALETRPFSMLQVLMHYCLFQDRRKRHLFWV